MIEQVNSLEEARDWFLGQSAGEVICVRGIHTTLAFCYLDAERFFSEPLPNFSVELDVEGNPKIERVPNP